ncbi:MAG: hydantoinase/oxoprolinase family protein [Candidatus Bipolaricaulota bacterium]|nr:hydantoinase/oxoprolinase family protein [Candidatus Bipolaricaulota bacterium]
MQLGLGIDTGNTYTDSALVDLANGEILTAAKTPTTPHDLLHGILASIDRGMQGMDPDNVALVAVSTTLATNAIVEGRGSPVALILLGWLPERITTLPPCRLISVEGEFNARGEERRPLNEGQLRRGLQELPSEIEGIAVSGYFSVRNPGHERRTKEIAIGETGLPVVCGHELTCQLGIYERTVTATLNARITPLVTTFLTHVKAAMQERGIEAPLMVMRSDGSLVPEGYARTFPLQTILSGPAASAVGGNRLSGIQDGTIVDIGGTTTDIVSVEDGLPRLDGAGATVGGWKTRVHAVSAWVIGLGGDSHIQLQDHSNTPKFALRPQRVTPLAFGQLGVDFADSPNDPESVEWVHRIKAWAPSGLSANAKALWDLIPPDEGMGLHRLYEQARRHDIYLVERTFAELEARGAVQHIGFTPTDALHVLGQYREGAAEPAHTAAQLLGKRLGLSPRDFALRIVKKFQARLTDEILKKLVADELPGVDYDQNVLWEYLQGPNHLAIDINISLLHPLVGVGAPVNAFLPPVSSALNTRYTELEYGEVGNAVGAISGKIISRIKALVRQQSADRFVVFLPSKRIVLERTDDKRAMAHALHAAEDMARQEAKALGGENIRLKLQKQSYQLGIGEIRVIAIGQPRLASKAQTAVEVH